MQVFCEEEKFTLVTGSHFNCSALALRLVIIITYCRVTAATHYDSSTTRLHCSPSLAVAGSAGVGTRYLRCSTL